MATYTPRYAFPIFDVDTDAPDGPAQMRQIVERAEQVIYDQAQAQSAAMASYTPTINFNCGTNTGWYKRAGGSNLVAATFKQVISSGKYPLTTLGGLTFGLPVDAAAWQEVFGAGWVLRSDVLFPLLFRGIGSGAVGAYLYGPGTAASGAVRVTGNTWGTWAIDDEFFGQLTYRAGS